MSSSELFRREALLLGDFLPESFKLSLEENPLRLEGIVPLIDKYNNVTDSYRIKIIPTKDYPYEFPLVYEIGNRLPKNIDWHIYRDGHFCIKALPEETLICNKGISLISFIKDQIVPFLFNQKFREENGYFLNERSHGLNGNLEFFKDLFETSDLQIIKKCLVFISRKSNPKRTSLCFCGSGKKYRKCHRNAYQKLSSLPNEFFALYINMIEL